MHYIYLKSTREIVGIVYRRKTADMVAEAIGVEIDNLTNSELGGVASDYESVEGATAPDGKVPEINTDLELVFVTDPQIAVRATEQANRESGQAKLKALGLTDAEVAALSSK
jgi:hypothetical protein